MTPQELVSDALDAIAADANEEIVAGAQSRQVYQQFIADPKALQAMMLTRRSRPTKGLRMFLARRAYHAIRQVKGRISWTSACGPSLREGVGFLLGRRDLSG